MSYRFPSATSRKAEYVDDHVLECLANVDRLPTLKEAERSALTTMHANKCIKRVFKMVLMANDDVAMVLFGPRGGKHVFWNFGKAN